MMARSEDRYEDRPPTLMDVVMPTVLGFVALFAFTGAAAGLSGLVASMMAQGAWDGGKLAVLLASLVVGAAAIWGLSRFKPSRPKTAAVTMLLAFVSLAGLVGAGAIVKVLSDQNLLWRLGTWPTLGFFAGNLLVGVAGIGALLWLKPWKGWKAAAAPVSPATRKANRLFGLKELGALVAMLVLYLGTFSPAHPFAIFSNSPVPLWVAIVVIAGWLLARVLREWWGNSADEHERQAHAFGRSIGVGVFFALTPAWWVAARAGLVPQPDAMILWVIVQIVVSAAWPWRRYH